MAVLRRKLQAQQPGIVVGRQQPPMPGTGNRNGITTHLNTNNTLTHTHNTHTQPGNNTTHTTNILPQINTNNNILGTGLQTQVGNANQRPIAAQQAHLHQVQIMRNVTSNPAISSSRLQVKLTFFVFFFCLLL